MATRVTGTVTVKVSSGVQVKFTDDKGKSQVKTFSTTDPYKEGDDITVEKGLLGEWHLVGAYDVDDADLDAHWKKR